MNDFAVIRAMLQHVLGPEIGIGITNPGISSGRLLPEEEPAMVRAIEKRKTEFTAGRVAARMAMQDLGLPPAAIPMAKDRSPVWPSGLIGSITHCEDLCIALISSDRHWVGIGVDAETKTPLSASHVSVICTPAEQNWLRSQPIKAQERLAKEIFCAKESTYKALYPSIGRILEFDEVEFDLPLGRSVVLSENGSKQKLAIQVDPITVENKIIVISCLSQKPA